MEVRRSRTRNRLGTHVGFLSAAPGAGKNGPKMNSEAIAKEMELVFLRCRAGPDLGRSGRQGDRDAGGNAAGLGPGEAGTQARRAPGHARGQERAGPGAGWLTGASLTSSSGQALSGKEIARLVLQNYMDEQAGKPPTFSRGGLRTGAGHAPGTAREAAVYNAWIEAARIVDYTSLEAIGKALEAEKRLVWVISSILGCCAKGCSGMPGSVPPGSSLRRNGRPSRRGGSRPGGRGWRRRRSPSADPVEHRAPPGQPTDGTAVHDGFPQVFARLLDVATGRAQPAFATAWRGAQRHCASLPNRARNSASLSPVTRRRNPLSPTNRLPDVSDPLKP